MSDSTIQGLRFRRVLLTDSASGSGYVAASARASEVCDALVCRRCTAVLADSGEAMRHVCVTRYWMAGMSFADVEAVEAPDAIRSRVALANNANLGDLWPHDWRLISSRRAVPLSERYELLSVLFAELAKMERGVEARPRKARRR